MTKSRVLLRVLSQNRDGITRFIMLGTLKYHRRRRAGSTLGRCGRTPARCNRRRARSHQELAADAVEFHRQRPRSRRAGRIHAAGRVDADAARRPDHRLWHSTRGERAAEAGNVVFHIAVQRRRASWAAEMTPGTRIASVHPLRSFADTRAGAQTFSGTYCPLKAMPMRLPCSSRLRVGRRARLGNRPAFKTIYPPRA